MENSVRVRWIGRGVMTLLFAALLDACSTMSGTVRDRAAADYRCDPNAVMVEELPGNAYRASACGHQATYVCERQQQSTYVAGDVICRRESAP